MASQIKMNWLKLNRFTQILSICTMFFIISKILSFLTDPFFWIILLFLIGLFNKKKYKRRRFLMAGFISIFIFSNSLIYKLFFSFWEVESNPLKEQYDYGILLGGMISLNSSKDNIEFNTASDRLLKTIEKPKIIENNSNVTLSTRVRFGFKMIILNFT